MSFFDDASFLSWGGGVHLRTLAVMAFVVIACLAIQRAFKRELERDQYYYLRDISLLASWAICGIWTQRAPMKLMITAGVISGLIGFCQKVVKGWDLRFCYLAVGFGVAVLGPRVSFIGSPEGEFLYISNVTAITILSTLWISLFPILFQEIDEIPGLGGCFLMSSWSFMTFITLVSSKGMSDAMIMSLCGTALFLVFWSRHINVYRRLGSPLSAMWGALLAGTSMLGSSRGVAFAPVMIVTLGLFAVPIMETCISVLSAAFSPKPVGNMIFYRRLVSSGMDHPAAVYFVAMSCSAFGGFFALLQSREADPVKIALSALFVAVGLFAASSKSFGKNRHAGDGRAHLWGISVDNLSLDYALGRVSGWLSSGSGHHLIVTPDALAALRSRTDAEYSMAVKSAGLVIPDGTGLVWALRFLGHPISERIPGVEFSDHLCRIASARGWSVYFFGGKPGIAELAAAKQCERYPGLKVAGTKDGYFTEEESEAIADEIRASGADIVLVALGVPKQECWASRYLERMGCKVAIGVGGTLDVMSGTVKRAPVRWQELHLEWLYRAFQDPSKWRRVAKLPLFVILVMMKKFAGR